MGIMAGTVSDDSNSWFGFVSICRRVIGSVGCTVVAGVVVVGPGSDILVDRSGLRLGNTGLGFIC